MSNTFEPADPEKRQSETVVDDESNSFAGDDARLAAMGYTAELNRKFSLLSCLAVGFSVSSHDHPPPFPIRHFLFCFCSSPS